MRLPFKVQYVLFSVPNIPTHYYFVLSETTLKHIQYALAYNYDGPLPDDSIVISKEDFWHVP